MDIKQLRYFIEVAEREHISQAALELEVAQSAISRQIANLEQEFGTMLFIRDGRNIKLTREGEALLERAYHIVQYADDTKRIIMKEAIEKDQTLYLGYAESYLSQSLTAIIRSFEKDTEEMMIATTNDASTLLNQLKSRQLDIVIAGQHESDSSIKQIPLYEEHFKLLIHSRNDLSMTQQPNIHQLKQLKIFIPYQYEYTINTLFRNEPINRIFHYSSESYAKTLLQKDNYALIIPDYMSFQFKDDNITALSLSHIIKRNIALYYQPANTKHYMEDAIRHLTKYLQKTTTYY